MSALLQIINRARVVSPLISLLARPTFQQQSICLQPNVTAIQFTPTAGLKHVKAVHRRCEDCQVIRHEGRLAVSCPTHGRHNQIQYTKVPSLRRLHKPYPWRYPDPFQRKYSSASEWYADRYMNTFQKKK